MHGTEWEVSSYTPLALGDFSRELEMLCSYWGGVLWYTQLLWCTQLSKLMHYI